MPPSRLNIPFTRLLRGLTGTPLGGRTMLSDLYCSCYRLLSGSSRLLWVGYVFVFVVVFLFTNLLNAMLLMVRIVAQAPKLRARCFFMLRPGSFSFRLHGRRNFVVRAHLFSPPAFGLPCSLHCSWLTFSLSYYVFVTAIFNFHRCPLLATLC